MYRTCYKKPRKKGEYKVRNQFTETFSVYELAKLTKVQQKVELI